MEDPDIILDALNDFEKKGGKDIPQTLEELLCDIAKTGETKFPWSKLKRLFICKLEKVIQEFVDINPNEDIPILPNVENVEYDDMRKRLIRCLESFNSAPFTIQRLCELITEPTKYYNRSDKFMRGIEKNVLVVTTVPPFARHATPEHRTNGSAMVNGILSDIVAPTHVGSISSTQTHEEDSNHHEDEEEEEDDDDDDDDIAADKTQTENCVTTHEEAEAMEVSYDSMPVSTGVETTGREDMKSDEEHEKSDDTSEAVQTSEQEQQDSESTTEERSTADADKVENMQVSSSEAEAEQKDMEKLSEPNQEDKEKDMERSTTEPTEERDKPDESSAVVSTTTVIEEPSKPENDQQETDKTSESNQDDPEDERDEPDPKRPRYDTVESETTATTSTTETNNQLKQTDTSDDQSWKPEEDKVPDSQSNEKGDDILSDSQLPEKTDKTDTDECQSKDDSICESVNEKRKEEEEITTDQSQTIDEREESSIESKQDSEIAKDSEETIESSNEPTELKSNGDDDDDADDDDDDDDDDKRTEAPNEKGDCPVPEDEPMDES